MTYKEKMDKEHPVVDPDYVIFSCPGHYFPDAPNCHHDNCPRKGNPNSSQVTCYQCWTQEIPEPKAVYIPEVQLEEKQPLDTKKIANRVKELYNAFRDEQLNHQEAFDITKIIIAEEVRYGMSSRKDLSD